MREKHTVEFKKFNKKLIACNLILMALFFIFQIAITSMLGTKSSELEAIREKKAELRLENEILNAEIDDLKSFKNISPLIDQKGLQSKSVNFLTNPENEDLALLP